jgi:DNA-directed RNA polymerase specialized sigma24 family protein
MTSATRDTLIDVRRILADAGWGSADEPAAGVSDERLRGLRSAYGELLRREHLELLDKTLTKGQTLREAGEQMGLSEGAAGQLLREALIRLREFADYSAAAGVVRSRDTGAVPTHPRPSESLEQTA